MSSLVEMIVVGLIVGAALLGLGLRYWGSRQKPAKCSSCASGGHCPLVAPDGTVNTSLVDLAPLDCRNTPQKPL